MSRELSQQKAAERVTLVGAILDLVLGIAKIIVGLVSHSSALIVDGVHSLSDLVTDGLVVVVLRISHQEPDEDHPWGHGRFETVGTVVLGCVLIAVAGAMAFESAKLLFAETTPLMPEWPALVIAALSILGKEWIFHYTMRVGREIKSDLIIANAWHSRTDALSSVVVLIGVAGAMMGIWWLDALAALIVSVIVGKIGWEMTWDSIKELVDTALPEERVQAYRKVVMQVEGIVSVHSFKSRKMAGQSQLEMHIQVPPTLSASEGHYIGDTAVCRLQDAFQDIGHVIFHIDTYNDETDQVCKTLPLRGEIQQTINDALNNVAPQLPRPKRMTLHYNDGVEIELFFAADTSADASLSEQLKAAMDNPHWLDEISIWIGPGR
ncbi:cation diffusion facilitator family transporter [Pontibacterium granulatum]|uniref:cation diffusion facilitator family transporter n=1 Tax=Pontibacterium granulatum TaxID=2036029 RepID=UPI00249B88D1|nr:cation diffusion facilitator family transporter [Pontibacterium granulatum]MDI3325377.1 cation diffusion facilitator family transporter [Pontibacterium granulatum]